MPYEPIEGFPDVSLFSFPELNALANVWIERRDELEGTGAYADFLKKLQREWAIETGIIERLYTWDRGVTQILIEQGIEASITIVLELLPRRRHEIASIARTYFDRSSGLFREANRSRHPHLGLADP